MRRSGLSLLDAGSNLSHQEASEIQRLPAAEPDSSIKLMAYFSKHARQHDFDKWLNLVLKLIDEHPDHPSLFWTEAQFFGISSSNRRKSELRLKMAWDAACAKENVAVGTLLNAAAFHTLISLSTSLQLALEAYGRMPHSEEVIEDCALYLCLRMRSCGALERDGLIKTAERILGSHPENIQLLESILYAALESKNFEMAESYCKKILNLNEHNHLANTAMGIVSVERGAIQLAEQYLLKLSKAQSVMWTEYEFTLADRLLRENINQKPIKDYLLLYWRKRPQERSRLSLWLLFLRAWFLPRLNGI